MTPKGSWRWPWDRHRMTTTPAARRRCTRDPFCYEAFQVRTSSPCGCAAQAPLVHNLQFSKDLTH